MIDENNLGFDFTVLAMNYVMSWSNKIGDDVRSMSTDSLC